MANEPLGEIPIIITGDDSQLQQAINDAARMAQEGAQKIASAFSSGAGTGIIDLDASIKELGNTASATGSQFGSAAGPVGSFTEGIVAVGAAAAAAVAGFAGIAAAVDSLVLSAGRAAEATGNLADRLNLSFEQTKTLSEMAQIAGISLGGLNMASMRLADSMEGDSAQAKKTAAALNELGVFAGNSGDLLVNFLEKLSEIPDATERISKAHEVLGRGAVQLEPLIKNYESLQEAVISLGGHIDSDGIKKLQEADDAADKLSISFTHLKESLAATFAPSVTKVLDFLTSALNQGGEPPLAKQIDILNDKIDKLRRQSEDPAFIKFLALFGGAQMQGPGFTPDTGNLEALKAQRDALQTQKDSQDEAIKRSKEYNAELDRSNALNLAWTRGAGDRAKQEAADAKAAAAEIRAEEASYKDLLKAQADAAKEQQAVNAALKDLGQISKTDEAVAKIVKDIETLQKGLLEHIVTWKQFSDALKAANDQILNLRFGEVADQIRALNDEVQRETVWRDMEKHVNVVKDAMDLMDDTIKNKVIPDLQSALPAGVMSLATAFKTLGLTVNESGDVTTKQIQALNTVLDDSKSSLETVELAWGKVSGQLQRIGKTDLPLLLSEYSKFNAIEAARGASIGRLYELEQQELQTVIAIKAQRGESATQEIIALENIRLKQEALNISTRALGDLYVGLVRDFEHAFDALGKGLADAIVDGKNFGDVFLGIFKQLEKSILEDIVGYAFKELKKGIIDLISQSDALAGALAKIGIGGGGGGASVPTGGAGGGTGGGAGAGSSGGALGALGGLGGALNLGVAVASGITQGIQMARLINLTGEIEISTRQCKEQLLHIQDTLNVYLPELKHLVDIWGAINDLTNLMSDIVRDAESGGGGGNAKRFLDSMQDITDTAVLLDNANRDTTTATYDTGVAANTLGNSFGLVTDEVSRATTTLVELSNASTSVAQAFDFAAETLTTPITRGEQSVNFAPGGPISAFTSDEIASQVGAFQNSLQIQQAARAQQQAVMQQVISAVMQSLMSAEQRIAFAGSGGAGFRSGSAFNSGPVTQQQFADWIAQYTATTTNFEAFGNAPSYFNSSQAQRDLIALRMGPLRSHDAGAIDVAGMTAQYRTMLQSQQMGGIGVTVNAVDPSGTQVARAVITGLQQNGVRIR